MVQATRGCGDRVLRAQRSAPREANVLRGGGMAPGIVSCVPWSPPRNSPALAPTLALQAQLSQRPPCISPWQGGGSVCSLEPLGWLNALTRCLPMLWHLARHSTAS